MLKDKIGLFYRPTKSVDFCVTDDRFCWLILLQTESWLRMWRLHPGPFFLTNCQT